MLTTKAFKSQGIETEETKSRDVYMNFETLKKHSIERMKEVPIAVKFGADLYFVEDEQKRANRIMLEEGGETKAIKRRAFSWRRGA